MRCLIREKSERGEIKLPSCFGKKYDGFEEACVRSCNLSGGCMVDMVDALSGKWILEKEYIAPKHQKKVGRKFKFLHHVSRILRAAGRPMHIDDIAPLVAQRNGGEDEYQKDRIRWQKRTRSSLQRSMAAVDIGYGFFIWAGIWDLRDGGVLRPERNPSRLLSIDEIFRDM